MDPYINVTERVGNGCLATTFSDPTSIPIVFRKWILGDGTVIEGNGLQTINHNYLSHGEYDVTLIARSTNQQYTSIREKLIKVNEIRPIPSFIISQSFNSVTGEYWRFYFDQYFYLIYETNLYVVKSVNKVGTIKRWTFLDYDISTNKMFSGTHSTNREEIKASKTPNLSPLTVTQIKTDILPDGDVSIDELKMWDRRKDVYTYFSNTRGKAGYLDNL